VRVRASQTVQSEIPGPASPSIAQTCGRYHDRDRSGRSARVSRPKHSYVETAEGRSTARDGLKEKFTGSKPAEIKAKCIETLRQAGAVVDAKAPGDAAAFKSWLRQISQHVAEASNEGGFLGIGGVPVSEAEKATLTEISSAPKLAA
jgi:hypothetical protein